MTVFSALRNPVLGPPASAKQVAAAEADLGTALPLAFIELLREANGLSDDEGRLIYAAHEVAERNRTFEVARYAPEHIAIGDNSGGRMALMARNGVDSRVFSTDMGGIDPEVFMVVGTNLRTWLESGCPFFLANPVGEYLGELIDVYLTRMPANGSHGLSQIRQAMQLAVSLGELKRLAGNLPVLLVSGRTRVAHRKMIANLGEAARALEERPLGHHR